jgi:glutamine---fructose-6-phosphate transaminase (isomerizing)
MGLRDEIREQPEAVARLLAAGPRQVDPVAEAIRRRAPSFAVLAARGTSDQAGVYAQYLFGALCGLPVAPSTPSVLTLYDRVPRYGEALVLGISQSGRSPDIVRVLDEGRAQGALTVAITNDPESPLAAAADHVIELRAGPERSIAATKTYTNQLVAIAMLAARVADADGADAELARLPARIEGALASEADAEKAAARHHRLDRCVVLGRGYDYGTSREWALKLQELARVLAQPYSSADFEHGPIALAGTDLTVLAVAASAAPAAQVDELLGRLRALGCDVLAVTPEGRDVPADVRLSIPDGVPDWLMPMVSIVPGQLYAYHLTAAKGLQPDAPVGIQKVTLTT